MNITNVLIIPSGSGEKYKFATRWKIICLNPSWIKECLKKKYAVRYDKYIVPPENKCSTPIQSVGRTSKFSVYSYICVTKKIIPNKFYDFNGLYLNLFLQYT